MTSVVYFFVTEPLTAEYFQETVTNLIALLGAEYQEHWLQQDDATANSTMVTLCALFSDCTIISY